MKTFRLVKIDVPESNKNNPMVLKCKIEQRRRFLFWHYWTSPEFAPPHLFTDDAKAAKYLWNKYPDTKIRIIDNYSGNTCKC